MAAGRLARLPRKLFSPTPVVHLSLSSFRASRRPTLAARFGLVLLCLAAIAATATGTAMAKSKPCAKQVVADWYDDGLVGKIYPLECYRLAIAGLPLDVLDYSNAKEEIGRALAFAKQGRPDPGGPDPTPETTSTGTETTGSQPASSCDYSPLCTAGGHVPTPATTSTDTGTTATSGPSAVPIPLLVLGGLAVLLLAAGAAGYLRRRMGEDEDGDATPPASA